MRGAALWACGAVLAFAITAGAFLVLANLATGSSEGSLVPDPGGTHTKPGSPLDLDFDRARLASLAPGPGQELRLVVANTGGRTFSHVNLTLRVFSDDTAHPQEDSYYRHTVNDLSAGESVPVLLELDLSPPPGARSAPVTGPRRILEVRATTPEGVSAVRTAVVPM